MTQAPQRAERPREDGYVPGPVTAPGFSGYRGQEGQRPHRGIVDVFVGSDPGLNRLRGALEAVLGVGLALGAEGLFVHLTHAMQTPAGRAGLPAAQAALVAAHNHGFLVEAMATGAIVALTGALGVQGPTLRKQAPLFALISVTALAAMVVGLAAGGNRAASLAILVAVLTVATYARRLGSPGFLSGLVAFSFDLNGFLSHRLVPLGQIAWVAAEIGVAVVVLVVVRVVVFRPDPAAGLLRSQRSFDVRARNLTKTAVVAFDQSGHDHRDLARLEHQLARLNEAALMIDGQLANPAAVAGGMSSQRIHQTLFDAELALTTLSRLAPLMNEPGTPADQRHEARQALVAVTQDDTAAARDHAERLLALVDADPGHHQGTAAAELVDAYRFATSILGFLDAVTRWGSPDAETDTAPFAPSVVLLGGALPGATLVSAKTSASGHRGATRGFRSRDLRLAPYTRAAIQTAIAGTVAVTLGDVRSGARFYWAFLAVFMIFMGTSNAGEQVRKGLLRVVGTVVGIVVGDALAHAVGIDHPYWTITLILAAIFFAIYLMPVNSFFMVVGLTVIFSQLYVQTGAFTNTLLLVRLEETGIGAAVTILVVTLVLPLRSQDVLRRSLHDLLTSVAALTTDTAAILAGETSDTSALRRRARAVDAAYQTSLAAAAPIRRNITGRRDTKVHLLLRYAGVTRHYSRDLVADAAGTPPLDEDSRAKLTLASTALRDGLDAVAEAITGTGDGDYQSSDPNFTQLETDLEHHGASIGERLAIHDLHQIDTAATQLADVLGLAVTGLSTPRAPAAPPDMNELFWELTAT